MVLIGFIWTSIAFFGLGSFLLSELCLAEEASAGEDSAGLSRQR